MSYSNFKKLHENNQLLLLGNIWDAQSAKLAEEAGFPALGTSSHAMANILGYEDGENISMDEILFLVERIVKSVRIPVSVDFEAGYSDDPEMVATHVNQLVGLGVAGINIEDGKVINGVRVLQNSTSLTEKIQAIKNNNPSVFINARIDTYTTKHPSALAESIVRIQKYEEAGADGIFLPLLERSEEIKKIVQVTPLPINLFLTPQLDNISKLAELGVRRLSHGAKIFEWLVQQNKTIFSSFVNNPKVPK